MKHIRYQPSYTFGLSDIQVEQRIHDNLVNYDTSVPTKTLKQIILTNIFTLFNLLNFALATLIFLVKSYKNLLFLGVVFCNTIISIIQEIRAKKEIDKLSVISTSKVNVIRNGIKKEISINEIVLDDILEISSGDQIITDAIIMNGSCEVDESFITGESDTEYKKAGELLLSGSFLVSGKVFAKVEHIGIDNYTAQISCEAKYHKPTSSILMKSLNKIIKWISICIIPIGTILFLNQINIPNNNINDAIVNTVAGVLGMIPEGLVLLTSTVLAVSVIRLSKYKVLVKDLYCIETLARIDTLCLDKTGTITEGKMEFKKVTTLENHKMDEINSIMNAFCNNIQDTNATILSMKNHFNKNSSWICDDIIPFSSDLKYSACSFEKYGTFYLGAPEILLKENYHKLEQKIKNDLLEYRILLLAHSNEKLKNKSIPKNLKLYALLYIQDKIRDDAKETIEYFKKQGVNIKVISGDNVKTVAGIAKRAGIDNYQDYIDMSLIKTPEDLKEASEKYTIFGRVNPTQKRDLICAMKEKNHYVAMTGDGVNDVLALKEANCSIAMPNGSDAAKNIAEVVLLDSNFSAMPKIVDEGRRTVNNIEKSATLFLTKTAYSTMLAILFIFLQMDYPFMPIQLTLTSVVTIGIPAFVLALQPNKNRIQGNFFKNVLSKSFPAASLVVINIILIMISSFLFNLNEDMTSTLCVIMNAITGFMLLYYLCLPFNNLKRMLFCSMVILLILQIIFMKEFYNLTIIDFKMLIILCVLSTITVILFGIFTELFYKHADKVLKDK